MSGDSESRKGEGLSLTAVGWMGQAGYAEADNREPT